jgi:UDP-2,3-diacylglucosamine pyrophosphatase LpxH
MIRVNFFVNTGEKDPDIITSVLKMPPTRSFSFGEVVKSNSDSVIKRPWGLWEYTFEANSEEELVPEILRFLDSKEQEIKYLKNEENLECVIHLHIHKPKNRRTGFDLSDLDLKSVADTVSRLSISIL